MRKKRTVTKPAITKNRQKLLDMGYSLQEIVENNLNINTVGLHQQQQSAPVSSVQVAERFMSDEEILDRQVSFFDTLDKIAHGVANGISKALVISGSAGIGKSYGVEKILSNMDDSEVNHCYVTGHCTPTGLFQTFYNYRFEKCVIVFDDTDSIFNNETSLGILKHALDMKKERKISWLSKTEIKDEDGEVIPATFTFEASVIFISNINLSAIVEQNNKLSPHVNAIISRSLYLDCYSIFKTDRDYLLRIDYLKGSIFRRENIDNAGRDIIMSYISDNSANMRELSLRLISKLCHIYKISGKDNFSEMATALTGRR